jgi:type VI secretion system secreted protein VgrG
MLKAALGSKHGSGEALKADSDDDDADDGDSDGVRGKTELIFPGYLLGIGGVFQTAVVGAMNVSVGGIKAEQVVGAHFEFTKGPWEIRAENTYDVGVKGEHKELAEKDRTITTKQKLVVTAEEEISLTVGEASLTMKKDGTIVLKGGKITIEGKQDVVVKGSKILEN